MLQGLGFETADYDQPCDAFSGGWQMRIALARLLLSEPELLILDEPTNHLDASARKWLGNYVGNYQGTVVLVSHDLEMLKVRKEGTARTHTRKREIAGVCEYSFTVIVSFALYLCARSNPCTVRNTTYLAHARRTP